MSFLSKLFKEWLNSEKLGITIQLIILAPFFGFGWAYVLVLRAIELFENYIKAQFGGGKK